MLECLAGLCYALLNHWFGGNRLCLGALAPQTHRDQEWKAPSEKGWLTAIDRWNQHDFIPLGQGGGRGNHLEIDPQLGAIAPGLQ